jgi:aryl-alcohol dehydrogenase-like predicted oxidoreductase
MRIFCLKSKSLGEIETLIHATPAQIALAWVFVQGKELIPIPGTKHGNHPGENIASANISFTA